MTRNSPKLYPTVHIFHHSLHKARNCEMSSGRAEKPLPDIPEDDGSRDDEKGFGNVFAELESVDLSLGTTLRYFQFNPYMEKREKLL